MKPDEFGEALSDHLTAALHRRFGLATGAVLYVVCVLSSVALGLLLGVVLYGV